MGASKSLTYHETLGSGASGTVYRVTWKSKQFGTVEAAAKKIRYDQGKITAQQRCEIEFLKKLNHRNIIRYYDTVIEKEHVVIVTEFAAKGSLYDYLKNTEKLPKHLLDSWIWHLACGVDHLDQNNIAHCDLKSPNCILTTDDVLKICDFGIARDLTSTKTTEGANKGSVKWQAPEIFKDRKLSPKAAIYAFGIIVWEMVSCKEPYEGCRWEYVMYNVMAEGLRPTIPDDCPSFLRELMELCWHQDHTQRPDSKEVLERLKKRGFFLTEASAEFVELFDDEEHRIKPSELQLQKKIAKGHFATIHRGLCTSKAGDKSVAIKVLTVQDDPNRSETVTRKAISIMAKELRNTLKLTAERHNVNPNIVHTYGWSFDRSHGAEQILIVMEYLAGGTLHEFVKDRAEKELEIDEALFYRFAYQIANGMEFLESQKPPIIHRDLAARNILLDSNEGDTITCKVGDFGLARATSGEDCIYTIEIGGVELPTRWYEIESLLKKEFTTKSDVWSFGILLWEMTSGGDLPYSKMGIPCNLLLSKLQRGLRLPASESMPKDMVPLMESCWLEDPDERPSFRELKEKLGNA